MVSPQSRLTTDDVTAASVAVATPPEPRPSCTSHEETQSVRAMRIAIIRQKYRPDGGGERIVQQMRNILLDEGHDVRLICRRWTGAADQVLTCNPPKWTRVQREAGFARESLKLAQSRGFDLVQSHERIPGCSVYRAGDGVHASWLEQRGRVIGSFAQAWQSADRFHRYMLRAERHLYEHPDLRAVICNSKMVLEEIRTRFQVAPKKLHLIYNGVDSQRFHPDRRSCRDEIREQHGISSDAPLFLFVGSGWERKGLTATLHALQQVPAAQLLIVGRDKAEKRFRKLIEQLGLLPRIHFAGVQSDVAAYYGAADAFVLPALYDPFPNAILEAMASGLPVITSTKCGAVDLIRDGENGYVRDSLDVNGLVAAMAPLTDVSTARKLGVTARETVLPLTPERMRSQLTALYRKLLRD